jgi:serine/threonine-protein kinase HipA
MKQSAVSSAQVWRGDVKVGRLLRSTNGGVFEYDPDYLARSDAQSIAYRLRIEQRRIETLGTNVHPFFAGLLPEGMRLRALEARVKTSKDDLLSLLAVVGADAIGDISVTAAEDDDGAGEDLTPTLEPSRASEVSFRELLQQTMRGAKVEPALPGVQDKISAGRISVPLRTSKGRGRGAFILKLASPTTPHIVENEDFFLRMARDVGMESARARIIRDREGESGLLVERFDRQSRHEHEKKIHQEDACQFLDRYPADKYTLSCAEIATGIKELATAPIVELAKLMKLFAFSYLIANGDLHAKNVSLRTMQSRIELTPAYDLLSTLPYKDRTMALKLDGRDDNLKRTTFVKFGERFGVRPKATEAMLDQLCDVAPRWIAKLDEIGFSSPKTADLERVMKKRRDDLRSAS